MSLPTVPVTCQFYDNAGNPAAGARVRFRLTETDSYGGIIAPEMVEAQADATGLVVVNLFPNALGTSGSQYRVQTWNPDDGRKFVDALVTVPNAPVDLHDIIGLGPPEPVGPAQAAANSAIAAAGLARRWANELPGPVADGEHSAKKYAQDAAGAASGVSGLRDQAVQARDDAQGYAGAAEGFAQSAEGYAEDAEAARDLAQGYAGTASTHKDDAQFAAGQASGSAITAGQAKDDAEYARDLAQEWAVKLGAPVAGGEYSAKHHANEAQGYAGSAGSAAGFAQGYSGDAFGYSETARGYAEAAEDARDLAQGYEGGASGYASAASGHAGDAAGYAGTAAGHAGAAYGHSMTAMGYSGAAEGFAESAEGFAEDAEGALASFRESYLGSLAADPGTGPGGDPLIVGAFYWNTASSVWRIWNGSAFVNGPAGPAGVGIPVGGTTGQVLAKASGADYDTVFVDMTSATRFFFGPTVPSTPMNGDMWLDSTSGIVYTYFDDGDSTQWVEFGPGGAGEDGADGRGIVSVTRTAGDGSPGTTDTYTITYTSGASSNFTVYNGADGQDGADADGDDFVAKSGGTMTGPLVLSGAPSIDLHASTKKYVDDGLGGKQNSLGYTPVNSAGDTMTGPLLIPNGSLSDPGLAFSSTQNTGIYSTGGAGVLRFSLNGVLALNLTPSGVNPAIPLVVSDGGSSVPSIAFSSDTNTGIFKGGVDIIGFSTGGVKRFDIRNSQVVSDVPLVLPAASPTTDNQATRKKYVDDSIAAVDKTAVGLGNVDNTSDATKEASFLATIRGGVASTYDTLKKIVDEFVIALGSKAPVNAPSFTGAVSTAGSVSGGVVALGSGTNIDCSAGSSFTKSMSANWTMTLSNLPAGATGFTVVIDWTSGTLTLPSGWSWAGGTAPTLSAGLWVLTFYASGTLKIVVAQKEGS